MGRPQHSVRIPDFVEPMQAKPVDSIPPGDWICEIKFDGYRALAMGGGSERRILSRNQNDLGKKFTEVRDSIAALNIDNVIIDGEFVALDETGRSSFQMLRAFETNQERPPIVFYAFDLLQLNGKDLRYLPVEQRKAKPEALLKKPPGVIRYSVSFTKNIQELLGRTRDMGLEGAGHRGKSSDRNTSVCQQQKGCGRDRERVRRQARRVSPRASYFWLKRRWAYFLAFVALPLITD